MRGSAGNRMRHGGETLVGFVGIESGRVELCIVVEAEPVDHVLVFLVTGISEDLDESRIARPAAGVLRRAGALARNAQRVTDARLGDGRFLNSDVVFPVVPEIVVVCQSAA